MFLFVALVLFESAAGERVGDGGREPGLEIDPSDEGGIGGED